MLKDDQTRYPNIMYPPLRRWKLGQWQLRYEQVSPEQAAQSNMESRCAGPMPMDISTAIHNELKPGGYWVLTKQNTFVMSDAETQLIELNAMAGTAHGRVLCTGLGIGLLAWSCAERDAVTDVRVLEVDRQLIEGMRPILKHRKIHIEQGDAWRWMPREAEPFDCIYHDILTFTRELEVYLPIIERLKRRYWPLLSKDGTMKAYGEIAAHDLWLARQMTTHG